MVSFLVNKIAKKWWSKLTIVFQVLIYNSHIVFLLYQMQFQVFEGLDISWVKDRLSQVIIDWYKKQNESLKT